MGIDLLDVGRLLGRCRWCPLEDFETDGVGSVFHDDLTSNGRSRRLLGVRVGERYDRCRRLLDFEDGFGLGCRGGATRHHSRVRAIKFAENVRRTGYDVTGFARFFRRHGDAGSPTHLLRSIFSMYHCNIFTCSIWFTWRTAIAIRS